MATIITEEKMRQIEMLVRFFNMKANARYQYSREKNQIPATKALDAAGGNVTEVKNFFRTEIANGQLDFIQACENFCNSRDQKPVELEKPVELKLELEQSPVKDAELAKETPIPEKEPFGKEPSAAKQEIAGNDVMASLSILSSVVTEMLAKTKLEDIQDKVAATIKDDVRQFISDNYGPIKRKIEFQLPERKVELEGIVHSKFDTVLKFVQANEPVFLTGPAGSGKNVLCQNVAKALGLKFYFTNAVTQEYKLTGFTDAMGVFHESQFYKAFKDGGVFMLDEMDASIPEVLIILNAAIANRYFDFPAPIGYVEAHPDFRVIAAGNTFGHGADSDYVGRNQLDAASLDRFALVKVDYDERIEEACANGDNDLLSFCRKFRKATRKAGIRTVVSYRAISRMAKLSAMLEPEELLESCLVKSLEVDDLNAIEKDLDGCGKYSSGFRTILQMRKAEI